MNIRLKESHMKNKTNLAGFTLEELEVFVQENNEPKFRAKQLHYWIYKNTVSDFDKMTNLSKNFRAKLKEIAVLTKNKIKQKQVSKDGTIKYLIEFEDGQVAETVLMSFDARDNLSACVSTQVGCAVGCKFCATGKRGFIRNLTHREIVDQILTIQRDEGVKVTNIVYMGQGEPLLNYDNVINSLHIFNTDLEIGMRRMTISTSGIVPKIYELANENRQLTLALSLHASNSEVRKKIMPIENKYSIDELMKALKYLTDKTGRRVTIEYVLLDGVNIDVEHAKELKQILKGIKYNFNLIPYNAVDDKFSAPSNETLESFIRELERDASKLTIRLERGADIDAACGQLSGKAES